MLVRDLVQIQESLVHRAFQFLSSNHSVKSRAPLLIRWFLHVFQNDPASTFVLEFNELLGMTEFFLGRLPKEACNARQCDIMPAIVGSLNHNWEVKGSMNKSLGFSF